ncbi:hypothetical protein PISMIDRAFT_114547 [Pisolithus microcarpus 441]|uniref:Unplaced genomic scaffold scaffold_192, whole genome shotgun sequence n=1 Tax=Pisolithus microcarpus 441 TaxID=765257 RepID=A0A0C9Z0F4_9AGAM|nr:hypothetical protein PISMIDRAFT_114547 [Pisolithus microcarpus 441]
MDRTCTTKLTDLEQSVVPMEPTTRTFQIEVQCNGKNIVCSVRHGQFPMTPVYAFTDYRSQGQTLPYVIVDIATPPSGSLNLFNLYVALSRSSGRSSIRLL